MTAVEEAAAVLLAAAVEAEVSFEGTTDVISSFCLVAVASASASAVATMGSLTITSVAVAAVADDDDASAVVVESLVVCGELLGLVAAMVKYK